MSMEERLKIEAVKQTLNKIRSIENQINQPHYNLNHEEKININIRVDNSVAHGLFKPDPKFEGGWVASYQTFRAMKKDIFALGEELLDLEEKYTCYSCKTNLDKQFWHFCPHCGSQFLI